MQIAIPGKESVPIVAHLDGPTDRLIVFLNGMMAPQAAWQPVVSLVKDRVSVGTLTYDRFGQGQTGQRDPTATDAYGRDLDEVVRDLHAILRHVGPSQVMLVGNSIGCAIARRYTAQTPGRVAGIILLDSIMANSDFADDMYPSPDAPDLPVPREDLVTAREITYKLFSPDIPNAQGFDRRNMRILLPAADAPVLEGVDGPPLLSVLAHDPDYFVDDSYVKIGMPKEVTKRYMQQAWERYNDGLVKVGNCDGVKIVQGAGHFIQVDKPEVVADEVVEISKSLGW